MSNSDNLYPSIEVDGKKLLRQDVLPEDVASKIKGKTLEVYYYLAKNNGHHGVREIQRKLGYNSAALVSYHLNRLLDFDLICKTETGQYFIEGDPLKLGELKDHIEFAGIYIPRILMFAYNSIASLIIAILLLFIGVKTRIWATFVISSNLIFLVFLLKEAKLISENLQVEKDENDLTKE